RVFGGLAIASRPGDNVEIDAHDFGQSLAEGRVSGAASRGISGPEFISYIVTLAGIGPERQRIDGLELPETDMLYSCVVPITGLELEHELVLGEIAFYGALETNHEEIRLAQMLPSETLAGHDL